jgi:DNA-binding Xre family transcriptional regulator
VTPLATVLAERGISQGELERRTKLTGPTVSRAYHGRRVSSGTWVKIAKALDVKPAELDPESTEHVGGAWPPPGRPD